METSLLEQDCYVQSKLHALNYILLQPNQILMPTQETKIQEALQQTKLEQGPNQIQVRKFCSEYPNDKKSSHLSKPVALLQSTYYHKTLSEGQTATLVHRSASSKSKPTANDKTETKDETEELFVNEYGSCDRYDFSEKDPSAVYENSALRFVSSLPAFMKNYGYFVL